jgi:hypothetical protein
VDSYKKLGCNMSLKKLSSIRVNCGAMPNSDRFHQDISVMKNVYKGKWSAAILAVYCWTMKSDAPEI